MIRCDSLPALIRTTIKEGDDLNCWIYTNLETWMRSPQSSEFFFIDEDEVESMADDDIYESDHGGYLPLTLQTLDLYPWFVSGTLLGVIENASIPQVPDQGEIERFIFAANHYREYDDFYDYPEAAA